MLFSYCHVYASLEDLVKLYVLTSSWVTPVLLILRLHFESQVLEVINICENLFIHFWGNKTSSILHTNAKLFWQSSYILWIFQEFKYIFHNQQMPDKWRKYWTFFRLYQRLHRFRKITSPIAMLLLVFLI